MAESIFYYNTIDIPDKGINKIKRILSSFFILLCAYVTANMFVQLYVAITGLLWGYDVKFSYHWVEVRPFGYEYWGNIRVVSMYAMPPVLCAVFVYILHWLFFAREKAASRYRMFILWLQVCFANVFLTQVFILPLGTKGQIVGLYQTLSIVTTWFRIPPAVLIPTMIIAGGLSIMAGFYWAPKFHSFSFSARLIQTLGGKSQIIRQLFLYPLILATPVIVVFSNPFSFLAHVASVLTLLLCYVGTFIRHRIDSSVVLCNKEDVMNKWPILEGSIAISLILIIYLFFSSQTI